MSSSLVVNAIDNDTHDYSTLDKTWQEIYDAFYTGSRVIIKHVHDSSIGTSYVFSVHINEGEHAYEVDLYGSINFYADSSDGYPRTPTLLDPDPYN